MEGWIKLYRKFLNWEWSSNPNMVALFLHLLLSANHKDNNWKGIEVKRGQFITGMDSLSKGTGISIQTLRTCLSKLKLTGEVTIKSTNQFSIITISNYEDYQAQEDDTNKQTNKPLTTTKNIRSINNNKKEIIKEKKSEQIENFNSWLIQNAPLVSKMDIQLSDENLTKLKNKYTSKEIQEILIKMHNYKPLLKKNIDVYLTAINWLSRDAGQAKSFSKETRSNLKVLTDMEAYENEQIKLMANAE